MLQHNRYFDGAVQSIGFERNGRKHTLGVIAVGEFHFNTDAPERMTIVSGELWVKAAGSNDYRLYPAGTSFEVAGKSSFHARAELPAGYICEFL